MLKLMKYEFRKTRATLLIMAAVLAALEAGFLVGLRVERDTLWIVCVTLISMLVFGVYAYILISGIARYASELKDRSGYLIFMTPTRPIGIVLSKLVFTALAAIAATALFGLIAWLDFRLLANRLDMDPNIINQVDLMVRLGLNPKAGLSQLLFYALWMAVTALLDVLCTMCTAFLSITLSATLLQNRKGFLRGAISVALFVLLTFGINWLGQKLLYNRVELTDSLVELKRTVGWTALLNLSFCALFATASAWLLDRKVDL